MGHFLADILGGAGEGGYAGHHFRKDFLGAQRRILHHARLRFRKEVIVQLVEQGIGEIFFRLDDTLDLFHQLTWLPRRTGKENRIIFRRG